MIHGNYNLIDNNTLLGSFQYNNGNFNGSHYGIGMLAGKRLSLYAFQDSVNNTVTGNTIEGWDFQLMLGGIDGWVFLQNNIFGGFSTGRIGTNVWDNGYPAGGTTRDRSWDAEGTLSQDRHSRRHQPGRLVDRERG